MHRGIEPQNVKLKLNADPTRSLEIRGSDYKYISTALQKAVYPRNDVLYHGLEYMEIEFWDQLKDFIVKDNESYDYSNVIGKEIVSYGFISSTLKKEYATNFFGWRPQYDWPTDITSNNPLKEKVLFEINIKKGYVGAAYLGNFDFASFGTNSTEEQVLINRNCKFKIKSIKKENDINIFVVDLI